MKFLPLTFVALLLVMFSAESANASSNKSYRGFGACYAFNPDPDRRCYFGNGFGAAFIAKKQSNVRYTLCVTQKATGSKDCFRSRTRRKGRPSAVLLSNKSIVDDIGKYKLKWRVRGHGIVARATLTMLLGD